MFESDIPCKPIRLICGGLLWNGGTWAWYLVSLGWARYFIHSGEPHHFN